MLFPVLSIQDLDDSLEDDGRMEDEDPLRFCEARDGDHLLTTFVCDSCIFWDLRERQPVADNARDSLMVTSIRRVNLDAFWSRERSTVQKNRREGLKYVRIHNDLGEANPYPARGPWDVRDNRLGY
mmetsp:Transcript_9981/g.15337  ORF Transcript_9981/g.15337 Transcript_9981/m.15337 type:complete len:126 (-) Transcript_9981:49-426(-)